MHDALFPAESQADTTDLEQAARERTDCELLARFVDQAEKSAFESLVSRHKSMVMGVCRRVLGNEHAAEDAFQATFMVLLRRSKSIGRPELLANWLYGVAFRVARKARIKASREPAIDKCVEIEAPQEPESAPEWMELKTALDEELSQLPARHRLPLVLCYLDGKTNIEAARLLGCPDGSIANRLSLARAELRKRMLRRGMVLSATLLALLLENEQASATVSESLIEKTLDAIRDHLENASSLGPAGARVPANEVDGTSLSVNADPVIGISAAVPLPVGELKRRRRVFARIPRAVLWLVMLSWVVFPVYELVGASLAGSGANSSPTARISRHAGAALSLESMDRDLGAGGRANEPSKISLFDSDSTAEEDPRCKFCLGTNCRDGVWKAARNVAQDSILKKLIFWK